MVSSKRFFTGLGLALIANAAMAAPPAGREPGSRGESNATTQQQIQARAQDQTQRRIGGAASQSVQRQADAAQRRADGALRAPEDQALRLSNDYRAQSNSRGQENLNRGGRPVAGQLPAQAADQARLHSAISEGLRTGKPLEMDAAQRQLITEVFGDASLLDSATADEPTSARSSQGNRFVTSKSANSNTQSGSQANPRAKLSNAIRVRQLQISSLRDQALATNDPKLIERADKMEETLNRFLQTQATFEQSPPQAGATGANTQQGSFRRPESTQPETRSANRRGLGMPRNQ